MACWRLQLATLVLIDMEAAGNSKWSLRKQKAEKRDAARILKLVEGFRADLPPEQRDPR